MVKAEFTDGVISAVEVSGVRYFVAKETDAEKVRRNKLIRPGYNNMCRSCALDAICDNGTPDGDVICFLCAEYGETNKGLIFKIA